MPREYITAQRMRQLGLAVDFIKDNYSVDLPNGRKITIGRCDMTGGYELKSPNGAASAKNLIENSIVNSMDKEGIKRLIIDVTDNHQVSYEDVIKTGIDYCKQQSIKFTVSVLSGQRLRNVN